MKSEKLDKILRYVCFFSVASTLIVILISSILLTYPRSGFRPEYYSNYLIGMGVFNLILFVIFKINNPKFNKLEIFIFVLMILSILSLFGATKMNNALFGRVNRNEGLFVILSYYLFALTAANIPKGKCIKIIVGLVLGVGFFNIVYGLLQTDIIRQNIIIPKRKWIYARGFNGNSMYFASLISICYPIILGSFLKEKETRKEILFFVLLMIYTLGVVIAGSMAVILATVLIYIGCFIKLFIENKNKERIIVLGKLLIAIIIFATITVMYQNKAQKLGTDITEIVEQAKDVVTKQEVKDNFGTGRIYIWKNVIGKLKGHWIFGVGIDNLYDQFKPPLRDLISNKPIDKAHNEYLHKLVCEGVISGVCYLAFIFIIFLKNIKNKKQVYFALLLGFTCYSIQAFFGISVIRVSPIYFIVIGLMLKGEENIEKINKQ